MNGYFNNLAIRTVNRGNDSAGNLVQPRMASVFEPQGVIESTVETAARSLATDATDVTDVRKPIAASASASHSVYKPLETIRSEVTEQETLTPQTDPETRITEFPAVADVAAPVEEAPIELDPIE